MKRSGSTLLLAVMVLGGPKLLAAGPMMRAADPPDTARRNETFAAVAPRQPTILSAAIVAPAARRRETKTLTRPGARGSARMIVLPIVRRPERERMRALMARVGRPAPLRQAAALRQPKVYSPASALRSFSLARLPHDGRSAGQGVRVGRTPMLPRPGSVRLNRFVFRRTESAPDRARPAQGIAAGAPSSGR